MSDSQSNNRKGFTGENPANSIACDANYRTFCSSAADESSRITALLQLCSDTDTHSSDVIIPLLEHAVQDSSPVIRQYAVIALGKVGNTSSVSTLVSSLNDPSLRLVSLHALGMIAKRPEIAVPAIIAILTNGSFLERREAISTLGSYGRYAQSAVRILKSITLGGDDALRHAARLALQTIEVPNLHE